MNAALAHAESIAHDLRSAFRALCRDRWYAAAVVATLAAAIGLNVTVFVVMDAMLFRGFPLVENNGRLLYIQERFRHGECCISYADFEAWRSQAKSFESMAFLASKAISFSTAAGAHTTDISARLISPNGFGLLGVRPALGRDFVAADAKPGAPPVVILSHRFWAVRFGEHTDVIGRALEIDAAPATVIGVMPEGFDFPAQENLWMPFAPTTARGQRTPGGYMAFGRLAPGATAAGARTEIETISGRLAAAYPDSNGDVVPSVRTFSQMFVGRDAPVIYGSVWAAAWFVLLIACINLANLSLARILDRSRELATRIALGAGHWRIARETLGEGMLLAVAGGALAWWIAEWSVRTWAHATESRYQILDYGIDYCTLAYLAAVAAGAALLFSLAPLGRMLEIGASGTLKGDARGATPGSGGMRLAAALVAGQMALAIVLLSGTGVLVRSLWNVVGANVGVAAPDNVLTGWVGTPRDKYPTAVSRARFFAALRMQLAAVPGVQSASVADVRPVDGTAFGPVELEARPNDVQGVSVPIVGADYFRTVGASVVEGREFDDRDGPQSQRVAIVNEAFTAKFLAGKEPVGERIRLYVGKKAGPWISVVGVVSNVMQNEPTRQRFLPLVYLPFAQAPTPGAWFFARTTPPADSLANIVRRTVRSADPDATLESFSTLQASFGFVSSRMDREHSEMGKYAAVVPLFAGIALLLAAAGLYAMVAHSVRRSTKEIGVRMAVGATANAVRRMIIERQMRRVAFGALVGLVASLAVNRVLQSQLVGVSPYDPVALTAAPVVLTLVALLACLIPARRAMRVDPAVTLRND